MPDQVTIKIMCMTYGSCHIQQSEDQLTNLLPAEHADLWLYYLTMASFLLSHPGMPVEIWETMKIEDLQGSAHFY